MRLTDVLIETDSASSLLVQLSNGNAEDAMRDLRATLLGDIMELNLNLIARACKPDPASIARIYQTLRLIAAVNHNNPIPEVTDNKEARKVLEQAIADNPKQYEQLLERSKKWDHGIK